MTSNSRCLNDNDRQMKKLSPKGLKWLKGFHLIAVASWIGGAVSLLALYFLTEGITDGGVLYGINRSIHHVDMNIVVIPGAIGSLLTGLFYSIFSHWGFFKHNWLTFKWIVTVTAHCVRNIFSRPLGNRNDGYLRQNRPGIVN